MSVEQLAEFYHLYIYSFDKMYIEIFNCSCDHIVIISN